MTLTVYDASVPVFCRALTNLQALLRKGHTQVTERLLDPTTVIAARLHENMFPLSRQVQIATDHAKGATARLAGVEPPRFADDEKTFDELDQRIARTIDYISGIPAGKIEGSSDRPILLKLGKSELEFKGKSYLCSAKLLFSRYDRLWDSPASWHRHRQVRLSRRAKRVLKMFMAAPYA